MLTGSSVASGPMAIVALLAAVALSGCAFTEQHYDFGRLQEGSVEGFAVAPDGAFIVATHHGDDGVARLMRVNPETGDTAPLVDWAPLHVRSPSFTADGRLAFVATDYGGGMVGDAKHTVHLMNLGNHMTEEVVRVSDEWLQEALVSPSGQWVYLIKGWVGDDEAPWQNPPNRADLFRIRVGGDGKLVPLTKWDVDFMRDVALLSEDRALISAFHTNLRSNPELNIEDGLYEVNAVTGEVGKNPVIERRYLNNISGLCSSIDFRFVIADGLPMTIYNMANRTWIDIDGAPAFNDACFVASDNRIYFLCEDEELRQTLMRMDFSGGTPETLHFMDNWPQSLLPARSTDEACYDPGLDCLGDAECEQRERERQARKQELRGNQSV